MNFKFLLICLTHFFLIDRGNLYISNKYRDHLFFYSIFIKSETWCCNFESSCKLVKLSDSHLSQNWVIIEPHDDNPHVGLIPAIAEVDRTQPGHTGLNWYFEPCKEGDSNLLQEFLSFQVTVGPVWLMINLTELWHPSLLIESVTIHH